jgi:hypothetical protein
MESDPSSPIASTVAWDHHVNRSVSLGDYSPECSRAAVTEHCPRAASEHSSQPDALVAQSPVADGVDAAVNSVEAARLNAATDGALGDASSDQLGKYDHPVLTGRQPRDLVIAAGGGFRTHTV